MSFFAPGAQTRRTALTGLLTTVATGMAGSARAQGGSYIYRPSPGAPLPAWTPAAAGQLRAVLADSERHAIDTSRLIAAYGRGDRADVLTRVALTYAAGLARGWVEPTLVHGIFELERNTADLEAGLAEAVERSAVRTWLASLAPQDDEYAVLSEAYVLYSGQEALPAVAPGAPIRAGSRDPRLPAIARALGSAGHLRPGMAAGDIMTPAMIEAVQALQTEFGLSPDGVIGRDTLEAINVGAQRRARQLAVNLEVRRWLARSPPAHRIDVNIAAGTLAYHRNGRVAWTSRVVAGTARTPTPMLEERFDQLVINPPWNVPQRIANAEILPHGEDYLRRNDMYVVDGRVVQRPGPRAALGLIKFDMQNRHAIYLHDTPSKSLFGRRQRFFSHGCVRVENAVDFGRLLARESGVEAALDRVLTSGRTGVVQLGGPITVRLLYHTACLDKDGELAFASDTYGWDNAVAQHIGQGPIWGRAGSETVDDLGP